MRHRTLQARQQRDIFQHRVRNAANDDRGFRRRRSWLCYRKYALHDFYRIFLKPDPQLLREAGFLRPLLSDVKNQSE